MYQFTIYNEDEEDNDWTQHVIEETEELSVLRIWPLGGNSVSSCCGAALNKYN